VGVDRVNQRPIQVKNQCAHRFLSFHIQMALAGTRRLAISLA
jgi:hypothetical protein